MSADHDVVWSCAESGADVPTPRLVVAITRLKDDNGQNVKRVGMEVVQMNSRLELSEYL